METIAQEAKRLLEPIPEDRIIIDGRENEHGDKWTSTFHLAWLGISNLAVLLSRSFMFNINTHNDRYSIVGVNDGKCRAYQQATPKQRVMALLDDMIAAGY